MGKGDNAGHYHFFPLTFSKGFSIKIVKTPDCVENYQIFFSVQLLENMCMKNKHISLRWLVQENKPNNDDILRTADTNNINQTLLNYTK